MAKIMIMLIKILAILSIVGIVITIAKTEEKEDVNYLIPIVILYIGIVIAYIVS